MASSQELVGRSGCFHCLGEQTLLAIQVRLLADYLATVAPGVDVTPAALTVRARCFHCLGEKTLQAITVTLLNDLVALGPGVGGGGYGVSSGAGSPEGVIGFAQWYFDTTNLLLYFQPNPPSDTGWLLVS